MRPSSPTVPPSCPAFQLSLRIIAETTARSGSKAGAAYVRKIIADIERIMSDDYKRYRWMRNLEVSAFDVTDLLTYLHHREAELSGESR